jgi:hypothetical protein
LYLSRVGAFGGIIKIPKFKNFLLKVGLILLTTTLLAATLLESALADNCCYGRRRAACGGSGTWILIDQRAGPIGDCTTQTRDYFGTSCVETNVITCPY